jgi:hypothetical protein
MESERGESGGERAKTRACVCEWHLTEWEGRCDSLCCTWLFICFCATCTRRQRQARMEECRICKESHGSLIAPCSCRCSTCAFLEKGNFKNKAKNNLTVAAGR